MSKHAVSTNYPPTCRDLNVKSTLGLIGLGLVGSALVERLTAAGFSLCVYDTDSDKIDACKSALCTPVTSPAEVADLCRKTLLSLPNSDVVAKVIEGKDGLILSLQPGDTIIDTTTADPIQTVGISTRLKDVSVNFLDATILGSSQEVRDGSSVVMVGGESATVETCMEIVKTFARQVFHMGGNGKGAEAKLIVNLVLGLNRLVLAEGLVLGEKAGVNPDRLLEVLKEGAAYSRIMDTKGERMISGDFAPHARLSQHLKDVGLILELAERSEAATPMSNLHEALLQSGVDSGDGDLDNSAIIRVLRRMGGLPPGL